jgi:hypothetical protein
MSVPNISIDQHGNQVDHDATTPVVNYSTFLEELKQNVDTQTQSLVHRSLDPNIIYYLSDGTRSNHGVIEHLTWVSADGKIGEKVSDVHLERICRSYASRTVTGGKNRGGKRKTRKTRRYRK